MRNFQRSPAHASATAGGRDQMARARGPACGLRTSRPTDSHGDVEGSPRGCSATMNPLWGGYVCFVVTFFFLPKGKRQEHFWSGHSFCGLGSGWRLGHNPWALGEPMAT